MKKTTPTYLVFLALAIILNIFATIYILNNKIIYFWDTAGYWKTSIMLSDLLFSNLPKAIKEIYISIQTNDYNYIAAIIPAFFIHIFGTSRLVFILCIINFYLLPCFFIIHKISLLLNNKPIITTIFCVLSFPFMLFISLVGFVDIGGLFFILVCLYLYLNNKKPKLQRYFLISIFMFLAFLFRRWYLFSAMSCFISFCITNIIFDRKSLKYIFVLVLPFVFCTIAFMHGFLINKLIMYNYANSYSAYSLGFGYSASMFARHYGIAILVLFFLFSIILLFNENQRKNVTFISLQAVICFIIFSSIQSHGQQHLLLYTANILVVFIIAFSNISTQKFKLAFILLALACTIFPLITPSQSPVLTLPVKKYTLFPSLSLQPKHRNDINELVKLSAYLDDISEKGSKSVSVLASSFVINDDIIRNTLCSVSLKSVPIDDKNYIVYLPQVDGRDKFNDTLFNCDYIVVASPVQLHLSPENQKLVSIPTQSFLQNTDIANAFVKTETKFKLDNNVDVYIYKRIREVSKEEKSILLSRLRLY